jgi:hypothetical protein
MENVDAFLSTDGTFIEVVVTTCRGSLSSETPIGATRLRPFHILGPSYYCDEDEDIDLVVSSAPSPHHQATVLLNSDTDEPEVVTGTPGQTFGAPVPLPGASPTLSARRIARDPVTGELWAVAQLYIRRRPGPYVVWSRKPGGTWSGPRKIPVSFHGGFVSSLTADNGRLVIGVGAIDVKRHQNTGRIGTVQRGPGGHWTPLAKIPHATAREDTDEFWYRLSPLVSPSTRDPDVCTSPGFRAAPATRAAPASRLPASCTAVGRSPRPCQAHAKTFHSR